MVTDEWLKALSQMKFVGWADQMLVKLTQR